MHLFVKNSSVVRRIWGKSDTILFIFAGASAEFALNKAVDWLYFTGRLPSDPLGRLFSTVEYARRIVFSTRPEALEAIDKISRIHSEVERKRGGTIPDWAYRDVLFMLIYYSIASYELLERKLDAGEKQEVYDVFYRVGHRMGLKELPEGYTDWLRARSEHLEADLEKSPYTEDLYRQYRKHLGPIRYKLLIEAQKLVVPDRVRNLLEFSGPDLLKPTVPLYQASRRIRADRIIKKALLPAAYQEQIQALDLIVD